MRRMRVALLLLAGVFGLPVFTRAQQDAKPAAQGSTAADDLATARKKLSAAETAFPGNTPEVAAALNNLISIERDAGTADQETLALVDRVIQIEEATESTNSRGYLIAIETRADVLMGLNRAPDARPIAEKALEIATKQFPGMTENAAAASQLGMICSRLGDFACAVRAHGTAVDLERKIAGANSAELMAALNNLGAMKGRMGDAEGAVKAEEEALAIAYRIDPNDLHNGVIENNLGSNYAKLQRFDQAAEHFNRAVDMLGRLYGPDSPRLMQINGNLAGLYTRMGQFPLAWKTYEFSLQNKYRQLDVQANNRAMFAQSLAQGGKPERAIDEGLASARMSREIFVLQARTLPERQALAYDATRAHGLDAAVSVVVKHPDLPNGEIYQEVVRSRALVADEMARRQRKLNAGNDPETARQLKELDGARADLLAADTSKSAKPADADRIVAANSRMESIERSLAERSAVLRADERVYQATTDDIRNHLPAHSVLISYLLYQRNAVDKIDPASTGTPSYIAFVLHPGSARIRLFDLGDAKPIDSLVTSVRAAADAEAHGGGMGSKRNERLYRENAEALRRKIWDPLRADVGNARLALVVGDGVLNLIPFAGLPEGKGYLVERGPVIHMLTSERDLVPSEDVTRKTGLLAIGSPQFDMAGVKLPPAPERGGTVTCDEFHSLEFRPLPGSGTEVTEIGQEWRRWNKSEAASLVTGADATRTRFLADAGHNRVLHVATHAFLLDKSCGNGNPLLHSGLVFAGANQGREDSMLTAQQIASLDLSGVDWAVLSACNTGNGELHDGEGVMGLERAFRVAGAHSVIMTLWPVDDNVARRFMHELYAQRLGLHATTSDAVWNSSRKLLLERRAAGKSTHPWYWAGFVGSGGWD